MNRTRDIGPEILVDLFCDVCLILSLSPFPCPFGHCPNFLDLGPNTLVCVSPQLLFDAMSLMIHHDVAGALPQLGKEQSAAERRDLAVVCCIDRLRTVLSREKANLGAFESLEHGYVEARWLQQLWPEPESTDSREGALHLLRMLAQAQLCFPLDDSLERFQFPSLLPGAEVMPAARLRSLCPSLLVGGVGGAVGVRLTRLDNQPEVHRDPLDTVPGCATVLATELVKDNALDQMAATAAVQAVFGELESVEQIVSLRQHDMLARLRAAQVPVAHEHAVCDAVARLKKRLLSHLAAQEDPLPVLAAAFPPDFIHHLQIGAVTRAIAQGRLRDVVLWRDGALFPVNIISALPWQPGVLVQLQVHEGTLLVVILLGCQPETGAPISFDQALPLVLDELVVAVRDAGNFAGLRWDTQLLDDRHLLFALQRAYTGGLESVPVEFDARLVGFAPPGMPMPVMPQLSCPEVAVSLALLLQRCGLAALAPCLGRQTVKGLLGAWELNRADIDDFYFLLGLERPAPAMVAFMAHSSAFAFACSMSKLCAQCPESSSSPAPRQQLREALVLCALKPLYRVFVDVLAWDTLHVCREALTLLRHIDRQARGTAGVFGASSHDFLQLFIDLLGLDETERGLLAKLLLPSTTLSLLINTVADDSKVGPRVQPGVDALCCAFDSAESVFPAAITHRLPVLQAGRATDIVALCTAVKCFFKPKLAVVWIGGHAGSEHHKPALCFRSGAPMLAEQLRECLQAVNADTTLLFLETCFSEDITHSNLVFEGLVAFAFAKKGHKITPGSAEMLLAKLFRAGHDCGDPGCLGCRELRETCLARSGPQHINISDLIAWLQFHRSHLLQDSDDRAPNVVSSLPTFRVSVCPFAAASTS